MPSPLTIPIQYEPSVGGMALNPPSLGYVPPSSSVQGSQNISDLSSGSTNEVPTNDDNKIVENYSVGSSIAQYMRENPGLSYEEYMKYMAQYSDEWAEKLIDYYAELDQWNKANEYTASREDTAYQRLVADLKKAGLNPALLYGGTASPSSAASVGPVSLSEGATYRGTSTSAKMKELLIAMVLAQWQIQHEQTNDVLKGIRTILGPLGALLGS